MRSCRCSAISLLVTVGALTGLAGQQAPRPNVVIVVSDDAGYADFSMQGARGFPTPRIDSIAQQGVRFTQGYVTASVCSPSRAGLLTGRYQQRFGHEFNIPPRFDEDNGLPESERTLAVALRGAGYRTIALGKWHLGYADKFHPLSRGFDDYFGFLKGSRSYRATEGNRLSRLLRDREPVAETFDYMTDELGRQAARYIEQHRHKPFFLYVAFNAVHGPMHARDEDLAKVPDVKPPRRRKLAAMTLALDRAVGTILDALEKHELVENTLVAFVNDNGGATNNASRNTPLRGHKGTPFEGGIRVPFAMRWPAVLAAGKEFERPVSTLDLFPTVLAAAGVAAGTPAGTADGTAAAAPFETPLDGVDLVPYLTGKATGQPHEVLHWRRGPSWAVRKGDLKLLHYTGRAAVLASDVPRLYDLAADPGERRDLAADRPDVVAELLGLHEEWASELAKPRWRSGQRRR